MIAYWFPPEGNAAVYRPLRFLRNLPASGWHGTVVAGVGPFERYDPQLAAEVPAGTEVVRVGGEDVWQRFQARRGERLRSAAVLAAGTQAVAAPAAETQAVAAHVVQRTLRSRVRAFVRHAESWCYHPDVQRPWIKPAVAATLAACARRRVDVLWATGPPWSSFIVAHRVARRRGVPYVLDFRTSWTVVPSSFEAMRPRWAQAMDRRMLRGLLADAQAVVFFYSAEAECFWRIYKDVLDVSRIHVIPNGFDGEVDNSPLPATRKFTILYTGTLSDYGYEAFLAALAQFVGADANRAGQIAVQFVGECEPALLERIAALDLTSVVSVQPPVPNAEVLELQRGADALLMLERKPSHRGYELLAGAKLFGYLKAGRPILGAVPSGQAARVLSDVGVSTIADAGSPDAICAVLEQMFASWSTGRLATLVPDRNACERYSGRVQSAALARALEGLPPRELFVPGAVDVAPSLRKEFAAAGWA